MITEKELNEFAHIIDSCRSLVEKVNVKTEISLNYIFSVLYGKALLTMCEIHTLLIAGYPEGAMALARNTYETMIILTYLYEKKDDAALIERFYDDYRVRTCKDHAKYLEWINSNRKGNAYTQKRLQKLNTEYNDLLDKYNDFTSKNKNIRYFSQYWWAGKGKSFYQLRNEAKHKENYLYDISCYRIHAGMASIITFDNSEEGLLIGACEGGKEIPMHFSLLNFVVITVLFFNVQCIDCSGIITKMECLLENTYKEI